MSVSGARRDHAGEAGREPIVLLACTGAGCARVFADDVLTTCAVCRASIYHRPQALEGLPHGAQAACLPCAARHARAYDREGRPATRGLTRRTLDEVAAHLSTRRR